MSNDNSLPVGERLGRTAARLALVAFALTLAVRAQTASAPAAPVAPAAAPAGVRSVINRDLRVIIDDRQATITLSCQGEWDGDAPGRPEQDDSDWRPPALIWSSWAEAAAAFRGSSQGKPVIPSIGQLLAAAKQFDDAAVCGVEQLIDAGDPSSGFRGRRDLVTALAAVLRKDDNPDAAAAVARLDAALAMDARGPESLARLSPAARDLTARWLADRSNSAVTGAYNRTAALQALFLRYRLLSEPIRPTERDSEWRWLKCVRQALLDHPDLAADYERLVRIGTLMVGTSGRGALPGEVDRSKHYSLFVPGETRLFAFLHGRDLAASDAISEYMLAVKKRPVQMPTGYVSGWADRTLGALEPLVRPSAAAESGRIQRAASYGELCEQSFRAALTGACDTHGLEARLGLSGAIAFHRRVWISPSLSVEPQISVLRNYADMWDSVSIALQREFGDTVTAQLRPAFTASGPPLIAMLQTMAKRFRAIAAEATRALGGPSSWVGDALSDAAVADLAAQAAPAVRELLGEQSAENDPRVAAVVAYDPDSKLYRCSAIVGIGSATLDAEYATNPLVRVEVVGHEQDPPPPFTLVHTGASYRIFYPVAVEFLARVPQTRTQIRRICDGCRNANDAKAALNRLRLPDDAVKPK